MMKTFFERKNSSIQMLPGAAVLMALILSACGGDDGADKKNTRKTVKNSLEVPVLSSTAPAHESVGVPINTKLAVYFNIAMDPLSPAVFTVKQGEIQVAGTVSTSDNGLAATFSPSAMLVTNSVITGTITTGAKSTAGIAFALDRSWTFTTGTMADVTAPVVSSTTPAADESGVAINTKIAATFSKPMDPLSVNSNTFTVKQGDTEVKGSVVYGPGTIATFTPTKTLTPNTFFTATISDGSKDLSGNTLATAFVWSFTTGTISSRGPSPVLLGTAGYFAVLAKTAISTVPGSTITGDIGISPAAASYLTGFSLTADSTNVFSTSTQIVGKVYAANYAVPTPANMTTAISNMELAYTDGQGRPTPDFLELGSGNIGGKTLAPGLYKWTSTITIPENVYLAGSANDVWIFQTTGDLVESAAKRVILSGGAQAKNVFWVVAGFTTIGTGAHFEGILLCKTKVTLQTGASMNGRVLAQTQVALQKAVITTPAE